MSKTVVYGRHGDVFPSHGLVMRSISFGELARQLIDHWIARLNDDDFPWNYGSLDRLLAANMVLATVTLPADERSQVEVSVRHDYRVLTRFENVPEALRTRLPILPGGHLHESVGRALQTRRPSLIGETLLHANLLTNFEMLTLPYRRHESGEGLCLVLGVIHSLVRSDPLRKDLDDIDLSILQLLREGLQMRQIGHAVGLSPRTVEHRIERLKVMADAKTLHGLVALSL